MVVKRRVSVLHPYECSGAVGALFAARKLEPEHAEYGESVRLELDLPVRGHGRDGILGINSGF